MSKTVRPSPAYRTEVSISPQDEFSPTAVQVAGAWLVISIIGVILASVVALICRRWTASASRSAFGLRVAACVAILEFVLLTLTTGAAAGWHNAFAYFTDMHWTGWIGIGLSWLAAFSVGAALAPKRQPPASADTFG